MADMIFLQCTDPDLSLMSSPVSATSRAESQALFLQERQLQFKKAALVAKKNGELALAKNYLRMAKVSGQPLALLATWA